MSYDHKFGIFVESVTVDGITFTFDEYKVLPKDAREELRDEAVELCVQANRLRAAEWKELSAPIYADYRKKLAKLQNNPLQKRREEGMLRKELRQKLKELEAKLPEIEGNTYPAAVWDIFSVWEKKVETNWEKFKRMVDHFDWYYSYSDDHREWLAGDAHHKQIVALMKQLGPEARKYYNQKSPWNKDGSQNKKEF